MIKTVGDLIKELSKYNKHDLILTKGYEMGFDLIEIEEIKVKDQGKRNKEDFPWCGRFEENERGKKAIIINRQ
jgi:hypothetical protein